MRDDATLLHLYASHHAEEAFAEIVRRHIDLVYSAALRRVGGNTHLAEDVTQQVFVALARKAHAVSRHPLLSAWLYVTTRNEAANAVRNERRRRLREQEAQDMDDLTDQAAPADWSRLAPVLDQVMDGLGASDRTAILLRYLEHRSFAEIGAVLRLSEDAARMRTDRALDKLRRGLTQRGIASTSAALSAALADCAVAAAPAGLAQAVTGAAIATTPATLATTVSILHFMSTTKVIAGALGVLILIAAGIAVHEDLALSEVNHALAGAGRENDGLTAKLAAEQRRTDAIDREAAELQAAIESKRAAKVAENKARASAAAPATAALADRAESMAAGRAFVSRHPEVRQAVLDYHHDLMTRLYGGFYRARGFSAEQIAQFEGAMMAAIGVFKMIPGPDGQLMMISTPTFGDSEKRKEENQRLMALLGEEGVQQLREYQPQVQGRMLAAQLAADLYYTATPLTVAQADQLVRAIAAGGRGGDGDYNWEAIITGAQGVLAQPQLDVLQAMAAKREYETALGQAMRRGTTPAAINPATKS